MAQVPAGNTPGRYPASRTPQNRPPRDGTARTRAPQRPPQPPRKPQQAPLSLAEKQRRAAARQAAMEQSREEKRVRRFRRRRLYILSFILSLLIVGGYYAVLMAGIAKATPPKDVYPVQVFRAGEKNALKTYTVEETRFNGGTYLPLTALQEFMTVTQYGDHARRSLSFAGGDIVTFDLGTPNCTVNGVKVSLEAPVFLRDETLYLPVDFFFRRMNCFEYTFSSPLNANVLTFLPDVSPALTSHEMAPSGRIDPATAPAPAAGV